MHRSPAEPARRPERTMGRGRLLLSTVCLILACMLGSSRGALQGGLWHVPLAFPWRWRLFFPTLSREVRLIDFSAL